jgi:hypothetical protein
MINNTHSTVVASPFDLGDEGSYAAWREQKLLSHPTRLDELVVEVTNPLALTAAECAALRQRCACANMAVYVTKPREDDDIPDTSLVASLGRQLGLHRLDQNLYAEDNGISALQVSEQRRQHEYIPYSRRAISWHTDGYYNPPERNVHGMVLHCARPAAQGGENALMDHEMLYLQIRDENPDYIAALMQDDVMTIPANVEEGIEIRPEQTGPVFSVSSGHLHMRYTARTRSIVWKADPGTQAAVECLKRLLSEDSPYCFKKRFAAGEGIISNNVLHTRTAFEDDPAAQQGRLVYRARYYDRVK